MVLRMIVTGIAVLVVLALLWFRHRRVTGGPTKLSHLPDRSVMGEAATAYEDLARQFLNERNKRSDKTKGDGQVDLP